MSACREPAGLRKVAFGFGECALLGFVLGGPISARKVRTRVHVRNRAVVHVAELVRLDRNRPAGQFHLPSREVFGFHEVSTDDRTRENLKSEV